ncbi:four-carbon acid sugar kinase family protein [Sporosarcina ureilytica]|uniref:Hydroxyacid dehydrogenase n=1 Tax=Sporosarcina ureilytica TaxID=298596 RepID=A0A1D8JD19_9BACL|nr:four-carbon acid sugar kinase family protein [Sporosarcina ureilytica]AOV06603.1 hydroxyacid dehydrogenase [Sporosarcina ureilytica]
MNNVAERVKKLPVYGPELNDIWKKERASFSHKIIVLDDDPTGVQTVHGIPVFTDWSEETICDMFEEDRQLVFLLTNSRAFSVEKTKQVHTDIAERIARVSQQLTIPFVLISRGDSTLRGHYPLETVVLKETIEKESSVHYDGEIILPFFKEGGRETIDDVHYVKQGEQYIPAGETEFAKDRMFGFTSSHLKEWIEEKTSGAYSKEDVLSISLEELRTLDFTSMVNKLLQLKDFQKLIVNAVTEDDVKAFSIALLRAIKAGKHYLFRTAASFTKVIGDVSSKPYLTKDELITESNQNGGLVVVGSHVQKTTDQLNRLKELADIHFVEFNCHLVTNEDLFAEEIVRIQQLINTKIAEGTTVCVYTSRERLDLEDGREEEELALSVKISNAVTQFVHKCNPQPRYVIAKGGITSSDIGTIGLEVKKAEVMGQVAPGVPVWKTGGESIFPHIPYIIFPGNVGEDDTLKRVVQALQSK